MNKKLTFKDLETTAVEQILFEKNKKNGKISNWRRNDTKYYGAKEPTNASRANVNLAKTQEFVHTILSKIDTPLIFKFQKTKNAQTKRVELLNSLRKFDAKRNNWDIKDIAGKKQGTMYGRAIYYYNAKNTDGIYQPNLENIDVYDFLIDNTVGGIDIEHARYMGNYNIVLTRAELEAGVKKGIYNKGKVQLLLSGEGNITEETKQKQDKRDRETADTTETKTSMQSKDLFIFWRWFMKINGVMYYVLLTDTGTAIRAEEAKNVLPEVDGNVMYPYWSWATFIDLTKFWTPSFVDFASEIFDAQNITINQMLDNADAINKPQKAIDISKVKDKTSLRKKMIILQPDTNANQAIQSLNVPSISTPLKVYEALDLIQQKSSGVTDGVSGTSDIKGKVGIYEGNQLAIADKFNLLDKSYSFGYERFAELYKRGVETYLTKKIAVKITGVHGVEIKKVNKNDLMKKNDDYSIVVESSNADFLANTQKSKDKLNYLTNLVNDQEVNQKVRKEMLGKLSGFSEDEIERLLDVSNYANSELMSEADKDVESLLNGEDVPINDLANNAYKQKLVHYLRDYKHDMTDKQYLHIAQYIESLTETIMRNETSGVQNFKTNLLNNISTQTQGLPPTQQPQPPNKLNQ